MVFFAKKALVLIMSLFKEAYSILVRGGTYEK